MTKIVCPASPRIGMSDLLDRNQLFQIARKPSVAAILLQGTQGRLLHRSISAVWYTFSARSTLFDDQ